MSRRSKPCLQRTHRPQDAPGPGDLRCDLGAAHRGPHRAGYRYLGVKRSVFWVGIGKAQEETP